MGSGKKQTIGYRIFLGIDMKLCHGPIDHISVIDVDEREAWTGLNEGGELYVDAPDLFGGDTKEGGVQGYIDIDMGGPSQTQNTYLLSQIGPDVPAYRGVVGAISKDMYTGINPYLKPWRFRCQRIHTRQGGLPQWYNEKAAIFLPGEPGEVDTLTALFPGLTNYSFHTSGAGNPTNVTETDSQIDFAQYQSNGGFSNNTLVVAAADTFALKGDFTIELDVNHGTFGANSAVYVLTHGDDVSANPHYWGLWSLSANLRFACASLNLASTLQIPVDADVWINVKVSRVGTDLFFYKDDVLTDQTTCLDIDVGVDGTFPICLNGVRQGNGLPNRWGGPSSYKNILITSEFTGTLFDMNPAHIIRECLTDLDWGMGYPEADMNDTSLAAAADTLFAEKMGISILWDEQTALIDFIGEILRHIDAVLYIEKTTGLFTLDLIRNDYVLSNLIVLDEPDIDSISNYNKNSIVDLVNSVTVNFWESKTDGDGSVSVSDIALVQEQGGVINTTVSYSGFSNLELATRVAERDLQSLSLPLRSFTVTTNRAAAGVTIGEPVIINWPDLKINMGVFRVQEVSYGSGRDNKIVLMVVEDVFATPDQPIYSNPGIPWEPPASEALPSEPRIFEESPYYEWVQRVGQTAADQTLETAPDAGFAIAAGGRPVGGLSSRLWVDSGAGYEETVTVDFSPFGYLVDDLDQNPSPVILLENTGDIGSVEVGTHFQIGEELLVIDSIILDSNGFYSVAVGRGVLDTLPQLHTAGAAALFWDAFGEGDETEYAAGEMLSAKLLTSSGSAVLAIEDAPEDMVTLDSRANRPYPPGKFSINTEYFPEFADGEEDLDFAWAHRDRVQQTSGTLFDFLDDDIGPEADVTYTLRFYDENDALIRTESGIGGTVYTYTRAQELVDLLSGGNRINANLRIELESSRAAVDSSVDAYVSYQRYNHTIIRSGWDLSWDYLWDGFPP